MTEYRSVFSERVELHHHLVPDVVGVGGQQTQHNPGDQGQRKLLEDVRRPDCRVYVTS